MDKSNEEMELLDFLLFENKDFSTFRKDVDARAFQPQRWDRRGHLQQENALRRNLSQGRMPFLNLYSICISVYLYSILIALRRNLSQGRMQFLICTVRI